MKVGIEISDDWMAQYRAAVAEDGNNDNEHDLLVEVADAISRAACEEDAVDEERSVTEVTFEVTVRHYVDAGDPNPTEEDVRTAVERHLNGHPDAVISPYDVESVKVVRSS